MDRTIHLLVLQHALRTVAERYHANAFTAHGHGSRQIVHLGVTHVGSDIAVYPSIEDARSVDAKQYAEAVLLGGVVGMGKSVHAALGVIVHFSQDTVYHARSACCAGNLARVEHVQAHRIVGLVTSPIGDGRAFLQAQLLSGGLAYRTLHREGGHDGRQHALAKTIVIEQELGGFLLLEVPHHSLRETADSSLRLAAQSHGDIVAWQHDLVYLVKHLRLVLLHPSQLGGGEISRGIQQMPQALICSQRVESALTILNGARVTPNDRGAQDLLVFVYTYQAMHLVRDTYGQDILPFRSRG